MTLNEANIIDNFGWSTIIGHTEMLYYSIYIETEFSNFSFQELHKSFTYKRTYLIYCRD